MHAGALVESHARRARTEILFLVLGRGERWRVAPRRITRERANHLARAIEDLERNLTGQRTGDGVVDLCPGRGIGRHHPRAEPAPARNLHPDCGARREQVGTGHRDLVGQLVQRRQVVENPERPALRAQHEVLPRELDVRDGGGRQVELQRLPVPAIVERHAHPELGAGVEQPRAVGIFAHHARRLVGSDAVGAVGEPRPALAVVVGAINVRCEVAEQEPVDGHVGGAHPVR